MTRRIAVVGPLPPSRSGVARHTAAVARAMARKPDVEVRAWSFARLYPKLLYPGDAESAEDLAPLSGIEERRIMSGANPLSWLRAAREIAGYTPDLVVLPAWTFFTAPALGMIAGALVRRGAEICVIVHNVEDHEAAAWKRRVSRFQLNRATRFVTHTGEMAATLRARYPDRPVGVMTHPVFDDFPAATDVLPRERALELLFWGIVRPYKGLDIALRAVAESGRTDLRLTVAGAFWEGLEETRVLIAELGIAGLVELRPGHVPDQGTAELFARADALVLPYRSATGSGVIPTACHYARPVIASDLPGLAAAVTHAETGWLLPPGDITAFANRIATLTREEAAEAGQAAHRQGAQADWDSFATLVLDHSAAGASL